MIPLKQFLLLFGVVLLVKSQDFTGGGKIVQENEENIQAVITFLNEHPKNRYIYLRGQFVQSQLKVSYNFHAGSKIRSLNRQDTKQFVRIYFCC